MVHLLLHTAYVPQLSLEETKDASRGILDAFGALADGAQARAVRRMP